MSVQTEITRLSNAKSAIKTAIGNKGVTVPSTTKLDGMATLISQIATGTDTSDATATASDIRSGKSGYVNGAKVSGNLTTRTASSLSASGKTVTVPAGIYDSQVTKDVATGSATTPTTTITKNPTISVNSSTGLITASVSGTQSVTPTVSAGYVTSGTEGAITVSGSNTSQLSTQAAKTVTPGTSNQTAVAAGKYTTGAITVAGSANLVAGNIKKNVQIFGVTGSYEGEGGVAYIAVTYPSGSVCTCTDGATTLTADDTSGAYIFALPNAGNWTVSCTDGITSTSNSVVAVANNVYTVSLAYVPLDPFATVSDADFVKMIQAAHNGTINLQTDAGWKVGDKRTISISAFTDGNYVAHATQEIDIAISSFADYESCGCVMQFDFVDELATGIRMNYTGSNSGGYGKSEMYKTTLPALVNALPAYLRDLLIEFSCKASAGSQSTTIETITGNKLALRAELEIFDSRSWSKVGEGSQIPYYTTSANRVKKRGHSGSAYYWWERSPAGGNSTHYCRVDSEGYASSGSASNDYGVAPFGCI